MLNSFYTRLTLALDFFCPSLTLLWDVHFPEPLSSEVILSLVLSVLLQFFVNLFYTPIRGARRVARNSGDRLELLIDRAFDEEKLVELSLRSRKTYIGMATETSIGLHPDADVVLVPAMSGYRREATLELMVTTNYTQVLLDHARAGSGRSIRDLGVAIPLTEVVSARLFDLDVFHSFRDRGQI